jgi:hypothetical protein
LLTKQVQFLGKTAEGRPVCQSLFGDYGAFAKVAGAPAFADWETGDELRRFLKGVTPEMRKKNCYVLVNALGAGEYFGANINSDYFPWDALAHEGEDYGHRTFYNAHAFQHHVNKDPNRAFGKPVFVILNTRMKRVELVIALDREKANQEGAGGIISRIDAGEFPDVSMGCKVPYDVCSICHHKSKTREDYCVHMRPPPELRALFGPNRILLDGRQICVLNLFPRFFDISFVFIGADKTAKVMAKLAQAGRYLCLGDVCTLSSESPLLYGPTGEPLYVEDLPSSKTVVDFGKTASASCECGCAGDCDGMDKLASIFGTKTAERKLAEIIKEVPSVSALAGTEPSLSKQTLDTLGDIPLPASLSAATRMGILLKPTEFQYLALRRMGEDGLADRLYRDNQVFKPSQQFSRVDIDDFADTMAELLPILLRYLQGRSFFHKPLVLRMSVGGSNKIPLPTPSSVEHPLLDKISAAYNGYRRGVLMKLSQVVEAVESDPELKKTVGGDSLVDSFSKTSSTSSLVSRDTVAYVMGAHLDKHLLTTPDIAIALSDSPSGLLLESLA